ncbi:MAG: ABC-2 family transporter protein [Clostridiales bacterium]|nr:ABC-2 family transporter protein [Clostridiales bacterium]
MKRYAEIYQQCIKISFAQAAAYRANFLLGFLTSLLSNLLAPLLTILIYANDRVIPGWSYHEALLIQSVFMLCTGLCSPFFSSVVWITMDHVREGTFDLIMLKPVSAVFLTAASSFGLSDVGALLSGIVLFVWSASHLPAPSPLSLLLFAYLLSMGACLYLGFVLLMAAISFKWIGNSRLFSIFDSFAMFGRYPATIFSGVLRRLITGFIPVAMLGFFPAAAILGYGADGMLIPSLCSGAFLALGWWVFHRMIYLYQSAGG